MVVKNVSEKIFVTLEAEYYYLKLLTHTNKEEVNGDMEELKAMT